MGTYGGAREIGNGKYFKSEERACNRVYGKHCSWDFYTSFLFQICFIAFFTFYSILKHPNKSIFDFWTQGVEQYAEQYAEYNENEEQEEIYSTEQSNELDGEQEPESAEEDVEEYVEEDATEENVEHQDTQEQENNDEAEEELDYFEDKDEHPLRTRTSILQMSEEEQMSDSSSEEEYDSDDDYENRDLEWTDNLSVISPHIDFHSLEGKYS